MAERRIDLPLLESQIVVIRGRQVLLDAMVAVASGVTRCAYNSAVRDHCDRTQPDGWNHGNVSVTIVLARG